MREESKVLYVWGSLIASGVPILQALTLAGSVSSFFKPAFVEMHNGVCEEGSLNSSLKEHREKFSYFVPLFMSTGEEIGELDTQLLRAADLVRHVGWVSQAGGNVDRNKFLQALDLEILARFTDAGIPVLRGLHTLANLSMSPSKDMWKEIANKVENNSPLSAAMAQYPAVFDAPMVAMIHAGEVGGVLDLMLQRIADYLLWEFVENPTYFQQPPSFTRR